MDVEVVYNCNHRPDKQRALPITSVIVGISDRDQTLDDCASVVFGGQYVKSEACLWVDDLTLGTTPMQPRPARQAPTSILNQILAGMTKISESHTRGIAKKPLLSSRCKLGHPLELASRRRTPEERG